MALRYLLDENQRGVLWQIIQRHNATTLTDLRLALAGQRMLLRFGQIDSRPGHLWQKLTNFSLIEWRA